MTEPTKEIATIDENSRFYDLIEMALEKNNADAIEQLVNLQNQQQDRQREEDFEVAYADLQAEIPAVLKTRNNEQTRSTYAKLDDIHKAVKPVLQKHGFSTRYESPDIQPERMVVATCVLTFKNGWKVKNTATIPVDNVGIKGTANKTEAHGTGSAISYARRYALCGLLDITLTDDDDGNAAGGVPRITPEQQAIILELLQDVDDDTRAQFYLSYPKVADMPLDNFKGALLKLKQAKGLNNAKIS